MADRWLLSRLAFETMPYDCADAVKVVVEITCQQGEEEYTVLLKTLDNAIRAMNPPGLTLGIPIMENFAALVRARSAHPLKKLAKSLIGGDEKKRMDEIRKKIGTRTYSYTGPYHGPGFGQSGAMNFPHLSILINDHTQDIRVEVELIAYDSKATEKLKPFMAELEKGGLSLTGLRAAFAA